MCRNPKIDKNIFKCADFWFSNGYLIQSAKPATSADRAKSQNDQNAAALDYYLSGVKIDPHHFGCVHNVACSYFFEKKYVNANKWFDLTLKIRPASPDALFGKTISCLKLGLFTEALESISKWDTQTEASYR